MPRKTIPSLALLIFAGTLACPAALLVYEGFNYPVGVLTGQNGGTGWGGAWAYSTSVGSQGNVYDETTSNVTYSTETPLTWDGVVNNVPTLPTSGARFVGATPVTSSDLHISRTLSTNAAVLAGPDGVLWLGAVYHIANMGSGAGINIGLGNQYVHDRGRSFQSATTDFIGADGYSGSTWNSRLNAMVTTNAWTAGAYAWTAGTGVLTAPNDYLIVLKYIFGPSSDTVEVCYFTENATLSEAAFNSNKVSATLAGGIDESTLTVFSVSQGRFANAIDEIRIGDTFDDAIGQSEPLQPLEFTSIVHDRASDQTTLTWKSNPGDYYGLSWGTDLTTFVPGLNPAIPATFGTNRTTYGPFANPSPGADRQFYRLSPGDLVDPVLIKVWGASNHITLTFSEAMLVPAATSLGNYSVVKNGSIPVSVTGVTLSPNGKTVSLTLAATLDINTPYQVTMNNLTDLAGRLLGNPTTGNFKTYDNNPNGVKVFILAGQSNMVGHGKDDQGTNDVYGAIGSLRYLVTNNLAAYGQLLVDTNNPATSPWATRSDVKVWWRDSDVTAARAVIKGDLKIGYAEGRNPDWFGPEYAFGWVLGDYYTNNPVLIIKTAWGGKSLEVDYRPPTAAATRGGVVGPYYTGMIDYVRDVLGNLGTEFTNFAGLGYQIVGFGWHQGWNDRIDATFSAHYESNLVDLILDLRTECGNPNLAISIGTTGMDPQPTFTVVEQAQLNVANSSLHPELGGNVFTTDTRPFWRDASISPSGFGYHWNHNGESHYLIGKGIGEGMTSLLPPP